MKFPLGMTLFWGIYSNITELPLAQEMRGTPLLLPTTFFSLVSLFANSKQCHRLSKELETRRMLLFFPPTGTNYNISKLCCVLKASGQMFVQISRMVAALKLGNAHRVGILVTDSLFHVHFELGHCCFCLRGEQPKPGKSRAPPNDLHLNLSK